MAGAVTLEVQAGLEVPRGRNTLAASLRTATRISEATAYHLTSPADFCFIVHLLKALCMVRLGLQLF